jgi:hypothetical protein
MREILLFILGAAFRLAGASAVAIGILIACLWFAP